LLKAEALSRQYAGPAGAVLVLDGVDLALERGQALAVTGPSGSGKSTLLHVLGALDPPSGGRATLDGVDPFALDETARSRFRNRHVGFVFQEHCLLPQLSVLENVLLPTLVASGGGDDTAQAKTLIEQVGLQDRIDHRPAALSGGERQRAAIARALIRRPRLLLCDEPTGNLDRASAENVAAVLLDLHARQQTILIIVTHSAQLAEKCPIRFELGDRRLSRVR
jgi:lipoprotein-releasing system ATP-binding protein